MPRNSLGVSQVNESLPIRAESYRLRACDKIINQELVSPQIAPSKDSTVASPNFFGMTVSGIDPRLVNAVRITLETPLKEGHKKLSSMQKDASVAIKKGTIAFVDLNLQRNEQGMLVLSGFSLRFNRSLNIKNPGATFLSGEHGKAATSVVDKMVDISLKKVSVDKKGAITVDGKAKICRFIKKSLPESAGKMNLDAFHKALGTMLGLIPANDAGENSDDKKNECDIKKMLRQLGAIANATAYSLRVNGDRSKISLLKDNTYFRGKKSFIDIDVKGVLDLNKEGDLLVTVDGARSSIHCSLGNYKPQIEANFRNIGGEGPLDVAINASLQGSGKDLFIDTFCKTEVIDILPRRRLPMEKKYSVGANEFNSSMGANSIEVDAKLNVNAKIDKKIETVKGSFSLNMSVEKPFGKTLERGITMDGSIDGKLHLSDFSYEANEKVAKTEASGSVSVTLRPSEATLSKFPELRACDYNYQVHLLNRLGRIDPPEYGITRFIRPVRNFEGHNERVDGSITRAPLYSIGSKEYFEHVEQITGAKLRAATKVQFLIDGVNSMPERLKLIREAKNHICFQTLAFKDDVSGWEYAKALVEARARGVHVYGVVDSLGNIETLHGLEQPHPIYEYLRENGVELRVYNSAVENGLRSIFRLVNKYPDVFKMKNPDSLMSLAEILRFLERVIKVAKDRSGSLSVEEKLELKNAIHSIFNGKEGVSPEVAVTELEDILRDNMTTLEEILLLMKRIGKASYRWHEKYLVADYTKAIVGGMNIADEYLLGGQNKRVTIRTKEQPAWRDSDVLLEGDVVVDVYRSFRRNWLHIAQEKLEPGPKITKKSEMGEDGSTTVSIIQHRPFEDGDHKLTNFLIYNLRTLQASEKAWFETAYFLPRGVLRVLEKELILAAKRGVDVRILTNSETTSDFGALVEASVFDTRALLEAGARVFHRNNERMVHAKVMVLGDNLTMIGSWNCDNRSAAHDSEDACCVYDKEKNNEMAKVLENDMKTQSDEIMLKDVQYRKIGKEIRSAGMLLLGELI